MASSMKQSPNRGAFLGTFALLSIAAYMSWHFLGNANTNLQLEGSVTKAHRLPAWLIGKLPMSNATSFRSAQINDALDAAQKWVYRSTQNKKIVDVITIGSVDRVEYMLAQKTTWFGGRNVFMATENNTENLIIPNGGSCQELVNACGGSLNDDEDACIQRRIGLAVGASVRRYRKIIHSLLIRNSGSNARLDIAVDESTTDWKRFTVETLPNYLILTFDSVYYNMVMLEECMRQSEKDVPTVFAPFISYTDANLNDQQSNSSSFAYPTNKTGVVFNKAALEIWIRRITCFSSEDGSPNPIHYVKSTHEIEQDFCRWMMDLVARNDTNASQQKDTLFDSAIRKTLEISLSTQSAQHHNNGHEFLYSSRLQAVSVSDVFSIYSSTMHLLCKSGIKRIPNGEEMLGYLIHRFRISGDGISGGNKDSRPSCKASSSVECSSNSTVACANLSLQGLKDKN